MIVVVGSLMGEETRDEEIETMALNTHQGLPWVSRNKRFALKGPEMHPRSGSKVRTGSRRT